jgi:hypothetical protein
LRLIGGAYAWSNAWRSATFNSRKAFSSASGAADQAQKRLLKRSL